MRGHMARGAAGAVLLGLLVWLSGCRGGGAVGGTGSVVPGASDQVKVTTDSLRYRPGDTITVTITNGLASGILAADHQSNCTTVTLERQDGTTWQPQNPCRLMIATRLVAFGAGSMTAVRLQPQTGADTAPAGWAAGTYRVAFSYAHSAGGTSTTSYSASVTIG